MSFGNSGLQYAADKPSHNYVQMVPGQPPWIPPVPYVPQSLQQALPWIITYTVDAVQQYAQDNPPRTYFFNMVAANGWNNQAFMNLLDYVIRMCEVMVVTQNGGAQIEATVKHCASKAVETTVAMVTLNTPALKNMIQDVNIQNTYLQVGEEYNQNIARINQFYNNRGGGGGFGGGQQQQNASGWAAVSGGGRNWSVTGGHSGGVMNNGGNAIANAGMTGAAPGNSNANTNALRDWRGNPAPAPAPQAPAAAAPVSVAQQVKSTPVGTRIAAQMGNWLPSDGIRYAPAYNPGLVELSYRVLEGGALKPVTKLKDENVSSMNWRDHIPDVNTTPFPVLGLDMARENQKSVNPNEIEREGAPIPIKVHEDHDTLHIGGDDSMAWGSNDIGVSVLMVDEPSQLHISLAKGAVNETIVCTEDPRPFIEALTNCRRLADVHAMLVRQSQLLTGELQISGGGRSSQLPSDLTGVKVLTQINRRLTHAVNRFVTLELAQFPTISSFIDDLADLDAVLKGKGPSIYKCWEEQAANSILKCLTLAPAEFSANVASSDLKTSNIKTARTLGEDLFVLHYSEYSTYAMVGLMSSQLHAQFPEKRVSVALYESETPALYKIAKELVRFSDELSNARPTQYISRRLIKTLDDVVFCIYPSPYQPDHYLIHQSDARV